METLHTIRKWLDKIVGTICIFLFALMVVVGSYQIITRFIFNNPSTISEELLTYSFAWMAMFATAYVFGKRDHMRMTFVVDKLAPAQRKVLEIVPGGRDYEVTVDFEKVGVKKMFASFAKLKKVE